MFRKSQKNTRASGCWIDPHLLDPNLIIDLLAVLKHNQSTGHLTETWNIIKGWFECICVWQQSKPSKEMRSTTFTKWEVFWKHKDGPTHHDTFNNVAHLFFLHPVYLNPHILLAGVLLTRCFQQDISALLGVYGWNNSQLEWWASQPYACVTGIQMMTLADTGSCCHSCICFLQVLVPQKTVPLYPEGFIFLIWS